MSAADYFSKVNEHIDIQKHQKATDAKKTSIEDATTWEMQIIYLMAKLQIDLY